MFFLKIPTRGSREPQEDLSEKRIPLKIRRQSTGASISSSTRSSKLALQSPRSLRRSSSWSYRTWGRIRLTSRMRWLAPFVNIFYSLNWKSSSKALRVCLHGSNSKTLSQNLLCRVLFTSIILRNHLKKWTNYSTFDDQQKWYCSSEWYYDLTSFCWFNSFLNKRDLNFQRILRKKSMSPFL